MAELDVVVHEHVGDIDRNQWNQVVTADDLGSVFHRHEWLTAVERELYPDARHLVATKNGNPVGVFPNFVIDLSLESFSSLQSTEIAFGGPVLLTNRETLLERMLATVDELDDGWTLFHRVQVLDPTAIQYAALFDSQGYHIDTTTCRFVLPLDRGWESIHSGMESSKRRNLKNARSNDPTVRVRELTVENLRSFHHTFERAMERVGGRAYPLSFLEALADELDDRLRLVSLGVDAESGPVGWHLDVVDEEQSTLHNLFSAVDESNFEYFPDDLLHEHEIKWAIENGFDEYDLGETKADVGDGLFDYKEEFGAEPVPVLSWNRSISRNRERLYHLLDHLGRIVPGF